MSDSGEHRLTQFFSGSGHVFSHVFLTTYAVVVVDLAARGEFGGDYGTLLPLMGVGLFLYGAGAIPAGLLGDRWSGPGMMVVFFLGTGLAAGFAGLAESRWGLWVALSAVGLFSSIYHPVGIAWLAKNPNRRGWVLGINGMLGNATIGVTPPVAGVLIDLFSWRAAFLVPAAVCAMLGIALLYFVRTQRITAHRVERASVPSETEPHEMRRAMICLAVAVTCTGLFFNATSSIMPKLVADGLPNWSAGGLTQVGLAVAPIYLVGAVTQVLGGYLADRYPMKIVYVGCWMLLLVSLIPLAVLVGPAALPFALLAVSFNVASLPAENVMYARFSPPAWRSTFYGIKFVLAFGMGWPAVEFAGRIYKLTGGFETLFVALVAVAGVAVAAALALPRSPVSMPR